MAEDYLKQVTVGEVEAHGGTISARNDGGLVFDIALPCEEEENDHA